ncbi:MAG: hypothetical protein KA015_04155 [Spirochaetes bacterium]|nr:hypothetical protein [Spirochaetota bacterium]
MKLLKSFISYHFMFLSGKIRIRFIKRGSKNKTDKTNAYFLKVSFPDKENIPSKSKLTISFRVKKLSFFQRWILPLLSTPFYAGFPGFISKKFYMCRGTNTLQGHYEWENTEYISNYITSPTMRFMNLIAVSGSLIYKIKENIHS